MPFRRGSDCERDEWLSTYYRRLSDPPRNAVHPKRKRYAPKPAPPAHGRNGALGDEVLEEDTEWDINRDNEDPMEDLGIT